MLHAYREQLNEDEFEHCEHQLFDMMADNLIYDVAKNANTMEYREAMDQLKRALTLSPGKFRSRQFWGAVRKIIL
jgi:hypothetical protein